MELQHINPYTGVYKPGSEALGLDTSNDLEGSSGLPIHTKIPYICGIAPDTVMAEIASSSWNPSRLTRASSSSSVDREREESLQGAARWTTSETEGMADPDKNLATPSQAPNGDNVYVQSTPPSSATPQNWIFEATMPVDMCPYSIL